MAPEMANKRKMSGSPPAWPSKRTKRLSSSPSAEPAKRKPPANAVRRLEKPDAGRQRNVRGRYAALHKKPDPHRYFTCSVPKTMQFADNSTIQEAMPDLERMGLRALVDRPWQLKAKFACQELLDSQNKTRPFPASHRVHLAKFDKRSLAALYDLPSQGHYIYARQGASKYVCDGFPAKYFTGPKPDLGWFYSDVRDSRLRAVFMVLNPIFCPYKGGHITKSVAVAVCMAWAGEDIDWAKFMSARLEPLTKNFGYPKKCYLSPYLLHTYQKAAALSMMEVYQFQKAVNDLKAAFKEEAMGPTKHKQAMEGLGKQKPAVETRATAKANTGRKEQQGKSSAAQEHEPCTYDFSDASSAGMCSMSESAARTDDSEDLEESDDDSDDVTGRAEEVRLDRASIDDPIEVDIVSLGANTDVQVKDAEELHLRVDVDVQVDDAEALGADVNVQVDDGEGQPEQKRVLSDRYVLEVSSGDTEKRSERCPTREHEQRMRPKTKTHEEIQGSDQKEQTQSFFAADSGPLSKLFLPTFLKMEQVLCVVMNRLGCSMEDIPSGIDAIQNDHVKLSADLQKTQTRLDSLLQNENALKEQLTSSISEERAGRNSATAVIQRLKNDLERSQKVSDDALSTLKRVREDELLSMNRVYALNMCTLDSAVGRFQNLLQDFEMAVPGGLENVIKRKLKDQSDSAVDHDLLLHKVGSEISSARKLFRSSLAESKRELEKLFSEAKEMRDVLCSSKSKVSGGALHSPSADRKSPSNDLATAGAIAREVLLEARVELRKEKQKAKSAQGLQFQPPFDQPRGRPFTNAATSLGLPSASNSAKPKVKDEAVPVNSTKIDGNFL